jgi:hypothetical protein
MADSCKWSREHLMKGKKFLDKLSNYSVFKKDVAPCNYYSVTLGHIS